MSEFSMSVTSVSSDELNKNILKVRVMAEHNLVAGFVPNNLSVLFVSYTGVLCCASLYDKMDIQLIEIN